MNLIAQNFIYEKIYIDDVFIYINEIKFDKIDKEYINLMIFDDLVFSNKKCLNFIVEV